MRAGRMEGGLALVCPPSGETALAARCLWYTCAGDTDMIRSFTVVLERDPESNWLVGEVVELPGCYTQAPDLPTLETNVNEAILAYLGVSGEEAPVREFHYRS